MQVVGSVSQVVSSGHTGGGLRQHRHAFWAQVPEEAATKTKCREQVAVQCRFVLLSGTEARAILVLVEMFREAAVM